MKTNNSTFYHTCPDCGANLDPQERCTCHGSRTVAMKKNLATINSIAQPTGHRNSADEALGNILSELTRKKLMYLYDIEFQKTPLPHELEEKYLCPVPIWKAAETALKYAQPDTNDQFCILMAIYDVGIMAGMRIERDKQ